VSNFKIRVFKEWVQDKSKGSHPNQIQISKGNEWERAYKTKKDLFRWLVLFQPDDMAKI